VLLRIVRHLRLAGENRRAVELLRRGLRDNPEAKLLKQELASIYVAQAGAHRNSRELDKAHFAATSACDLDPENAEAHAALGAVQEARHRWEAAGDCYQRALALDTGLDEARRGLARFHQARGIAALSEIRTRVEKAPEAERKAVEQNLRDLVMADFRQALDLAAGSPDVEIARRHVREAERGEIREASRALCDRARKDLEAGRLPEATELLRQAVRVDGTHHDAHYLLAQALAGQDDLDGALQSLEQVLSLDPEHFPALAVSARLYYVKGRNDEARKAGERALMLLKDEEARHAFPEEITMLKRILDLSKPPGR
jgi:tetratricopeptide (TPR) repeat protein